MLQFNGTLFHLFFQLYFLLGNQLAFFYFFFFFQAFFFQACSDRALRVCVYLRVKAPEKNTTIHKTVKYSANTQNLEEAENASIRFFKSKSSTLFNTRTKNSTNV